MFTGIIEKVATVSSLNQQSATAYELVTTNPFAGSKDPVVLGESIAHNGVCLTVTKISDASLHYDLSPETVLRTALSRLKPLRKINLERSLRMGDRMSGHWVQGHVDGTAKVTRLAEVEKGYFDLEIEFNDPKLLRYCVKKGSLAVDGISLTIHDMAQNRLQFQIIPHTWAETALCDLSHGDLVNFEVDLLAKYVEKFQAHDSKTSSGN